MKIPDPPVEADRVRFDKWLWAARFYKTRSLAAQAIDAGQARVNDERVKPAHLPRVGNLIAVRKGGMVWTVEVLALSDRRGGAAQAALLYRETRGESSRRAKRRCCKAARPTRRRRRLRAARPNASGASSRTS